MTSYLVLSEIDLQWAEEQYWYELANLIKYVSIAKTPKEKKKITNEQMKNFVR